MLIAKSNLLPLSVGRPGGPSSRGARLPVTSSLVNQLGSAFSTGGSALAGRVGLKDPTLQKIYVPDRAAKNGLKAVKPTPAEKSASGFGAFTTEVLGDVFRARITSAGGRIAEFDVFAPGSSASNRSTGFAVKTALNARGDSVVTFTTRTKTTDSFGTDSERKALRLTIDRNTGGVRRFAIEDGDNHLTLLPDRLA